MSTDLQHNEDPSPEPMLIMTDYERMCLKSHKIPTLHNILASFFTWILLAGFVVFPGTFTSLRNAARSTAEAVVLAELQKGLIVIAGICCGIGITGILRLWWQWRKDYEWLLDCSIRSLDLNRVRTHEPSGQQTLQHNSHVHFRSLR